MADSYLIGGKKVSGFSRDAKDIDFDPTGTDLESTDAESAIKEVNSKLTVEEFTSDVSFGSGYTKLNETHFYKYGHIIYGNVSISFTATTSTTLDNIFTIPTAYRAPFTTVVTGVDTVNDSPIDVVITSQGKCKAYNPTGRSFSAMRMAFMYVI